MTRFLFSALIALLACFHSCTSTAHVAPSSSVRAQLLAISRHPMPNISVKCGESIDRPYSIVREFDIFAPIGPWPDPRWLELPVDEQLEHLQFVARDALYLQALGVQELQAADLELLAKAQNDGSVTCGPCPQGGQCSKTCTFTRQPTIDLSEIEIITAFPATLPNGTQGVHLEFTYKLRAIVNVACNPCGGI